MKFIRYSKFKGFDVFGLDLGSLMDALSDQMLDSGYNEDYWWTRQRNKPDDSLDALRQAILQALLEQEVLDEQDVEQMLADNGGEFKGSLLEELINQLIERLVEEGYLNLKEVPPEQRREAQNGNGQGEIGEPMPRNIKFEVTEKGLDFLGYKTLQKLLGSLGKSSIGRHETPHLDTGVEAALSSKQYEFGDTINLDVNATLLSAITREGLSRAAQSRIPRSVRSSAGLQLVVRDGRHARLLAFDDPLRRRPVHAGEESRARARASDPHAVSGRFAEDRSFSRRRGRTAARTTRDDAGRSVSHEHGRRIEARATNSHRAEQGHEADRDGHRRQTDRGVYRAVERRRIFGYRRYSTRSPARNACSIKIRWATTRSSWRKLSRKFRRAAKSGVMINTFMLASDHYLVDFVKQMTAMTRGKAYFANPNNLTQFVLMDFLKRRTSRVR